LLWLPPEPLPDLTRALCVSGEEQDDGELLTTDAAADIRLSGLADEHPRKLGEDPVALLMATPVIDGLEVVDVQEEQRHTYTVTAKIAKLEVDGLATCRVVVQACQSIAHREIGEQ
jgi:hypothetical protein